MTLKKNKLPTSISKRLPFLFVNMAMTADGKIATANRHISSFGSSHDQHQLLVLRSRADAVMAGARTVDLNPVNLGPGPLKYRRMRIKNGLSEYNLRIIVSGSASINPEAEIFRKRFSPIIVLASERAPKAKLRRLKAVADDVEVFGESTVDLAQALRWLREKWHVERLLCEGGGELNSALFLSGLVNELHLTICPKIFGGRAAPTIVDGKGIEDLAKATLLELKSKKRIADELFLVYTAASKR